MATYIVLANWTDQGIKDVKGAPDRVRQYEAGITQQGGKLLGWYLTMGTYDVVTLVEAPDDETMARWVLALAASGVARTTTLKAFSREQFEQIASSLG